MIVDGRIGNKPSFYNGTHLDFMTTSEVNTSYPKDPSDEEYEDSRPKIQKVWTTDLRQPWAGN